MESANWIMEQLLGGALLVLMLLVLAWLINWAKGLVHKALTRLFDGFKKDIVENLSELSKSVEKVNKAVNDVPPGTPTMSARVDRIEETQTKAKEQLEEFIETSNEKFDSANAKLDLNNASIEKLLASHVETRKKFDEAIKAIPKRKQDYEEAS